TGQGRLRARHPVREVFPWPHRRGCALPGCVDRNPGRPPLHRRHHMTGLFNRIRFGDNLDVTDEGGGVIRVEAAAGSSGGGSVAADTLWDAKGDLAAASGPDAA